MDVKKSNLKDIGIWDIKITVEIENVMIDDESEDFEYEVWLIDPRPEDTTE